MPSEYRTDIKIRYAETDQMGVVHHAAYVVYLEAARTEHLEALGLAYHELEGKGVFLPVVELNINYLKPSRYGQTITVASKMGGADGARLRVDYEVLLGKDVILTGYSIHAFMGKDGKPMRPPRDIASILRKADV